jgi:methyl-accepting chemotaxis protein
MKNTRGEEIHIEFFVIPIFDRSDELKGVFEITLDRTESVHYEQSAEELVGEVSETLAAIGEGNLSARIDFADDRGVIGEELLSVTDDINKMAKNFQQALDCNRIRVPLRSNGVLDALPGGLVVSKNDDTRCRAVSDVLNGQARENCIGLFGLVFGLVGFVCDGPSGDIACRDSVPVRR